jgi:hypothetical protein
MDMQGMKSQITSRILASAGTVVTLVAVVGAGRKWSC